MNLSEAMTAEVLRQDDWQNAQLGMGGGTKDLSAYTRFGIRAQIQDDMLEAMFVEDHFSATIVGGKVREALRPGWDLVIPGAPADAAKARDAYAVAEEELDVRGDIGEGAAWGRLFGGAVTVIGADDGLGDLARPLDESTIAAVRYLHTYDRRQVQIDRYYTDPLHPSFGMPELYRITPLVFGASTGTVIVHESRVVRWRGQPTTDTRRQHLRGWDDSVLERCWDALRQVGENYGALSLLMNRISQAVYKIKGLWAMIAGKDKAKLSTRLTMLDASRNRGRGLALDTDEEFVNVSTPVGGVELLIDRGVLRLAAAAEMPYSVLMGQPAAALGATGSADLELWYASVEAWRSNELRPNHERIARLLLLAKNGPTGGEEPETWAIAYRPLRMPTAIERATLRKTQAETDAIEIDKGIIPPEAVALARHTGMGQDEIVALDAEEVRAALTRRQELAKAPPKDNAELGTAAARSAGQMAVIAAVGKGISRESAKAILVQTYRLKDEDAETMLGPIAAVPTAAPPVPGAPPPAPPQGFGAGAPPTLPGVDQGGRPTPGGE